MIRVLTKRQQEVLDYLRVDKTAYLIDLPHLELLPLLAQGKGEIDKVDRSDLTAIWDSLSLQAWTPPWEVESNPGQTTWFRVPCWVARNREKLVWLVSEIRSVEPSLDPRPCEGRGGKVTVNPDALLKLVRRKA